MRNHTFVGVALTCLCAVTLTAQSQTPVSYTVGIWPVSATNNAAPLNTAQYPLTAVQCGQERVVEKGAIVNPNEARFNDPANNALDCVVIVETQIRNLPPGAYKAAVRVNGSVESSAYGAWSEVFERQGPPMQPSVARLRYR